METEREGERTSSAIRIQRIRLSSGSTKETVIGGHHSDERVGDDGEREDAGSDIRHPESVELRMLMPRPTKNTSLAPPRKRR